MNEISDNIEIGITGKVSPTEIKELSELYGSENIKITKLETKAAPGIYGIEEIIDIIFRDYSIIDFTRDFILANLINYGWKKVKKVINYFNNKAFKKVHQISFDYIVTIDNRKVSLDVVCRPEEIELMLEKINKEINYEIIIKEDFDRIIHVVYENGKFDLTIM